MVRLVRSVGEIKSRMFLMAVWGLQKPTKQTTKTNNSNTGRLERKKEPQLGVFQ